MGAMHRSRAPARPRRRIGWLLPSSPSGRSRPPRRRRAAVPDPVEDQAVYDYAGVLGGRRDRQAEATIDAIEARTGAEVVVYTQDSGDVPTRPPRPRQGAAALMDQWGVGRKGFDDGLVILFDMEPSLEHGQVQLYAGPGFEAAYLSNERTPGDLRERHAARYLRDGDFDGALLVALEKVDAAATPEHAAALQRARQINAVVGLVGAPIVLPRPGRLGGVPLAAVRQGPGLPRRPVDPDAGAAARPDRRVAAAVDHGRRHLAARADDRDARPAPAAG